MRHARSEDQASSDFARELSPSGRSDANRMTAHFASQPQVHRPRWLVTSAAVRAEQTSDYVASGFALSATQRVSEPALYLASPETIVSTLKETPDSIDCVALVAHNPGLTWLINSWSSRSNSPQETLDNLPTMGCALFQTDISSWADLATARRASLMTPKMLAD